MGGTDQRHIEDCRHEERWRLVLTGIVQGVGFRPYVFRLATELGLTGLVYNTPEGAVVEAQGRAACLHEFCRRLILDCPPQAIIEACRRERIPYLSQDGPDFFIGRSCGGEQPEPCLPPDMALCQECRVEIFNPRARRYLYPFTNCTNCGPRYTIAEALPYDRPRTTMGRFNLCRDCRREYDDPTDRRFHAQPLSCPRCGPILMLFHRRDGGSIVPAAGDPIKRIRRALQRGKVIALKGLGGFHLACDANDDRAVERIRHLKNRVEKPFALLCRDLEQTREICIVTDAEAISLASPAAPIVLMRRGRNPGGLSDRIAPGQDRLGVMLPGNPLQAVLMRDYSHPLVMTSANIEDEPLPTDMSDIHPSILAGADYVLTNDRGIAARCDDSVVIADPVEIPIRRARGFVPTPVPIPAVARQALGAGAEMKNTACFVREGRALLTPHIGNLDNEKAAKAWRESIDRLAVMFGLHPVIVGCDQHPFYTSRELAYQLGLSVREVQHHHAHIASCLAENMIMRRVIGVAFDGTGYGPDGTIWGGEFLLADYRSYARAGCLTAMPMPGGEKAVREPWRMALAYLHAAFGADLPAFPGSDVLYRYGADLIIPALDGACGFPSMIATTSAGRLFDAAAALLVPVYICSFEGQAAMAFESLARACSSRPVPYPVTLKREPDLVHLDFTPVFRHLTADLRAGRHRAEMAMAFHLAVAAGIRTVCQEIAVRSGLREVALSGGVFQNVLLLTEVLTGLQQAGFKVYHHRRVPPNDGGISLGQAMVAANASD